MVQDTIVIHESKKSDKVVKFVPATVESLSQYCSKRYAKIILDSQENGSLWGAYFTPSGKVRAIFI